LLELWDIAVSAENMDEAQIDRESMKISPVLTLYTCPLGIPVCARSTWIGRGNTEP